jgi:hypothetical protein
LIAKGRACLQEFASQTTVAVSETGLDQRRWGSCDPQNCVRQSLGACSAVSYARGTLTASPINPSNAPAHSAARWISTRVRIFRGPAVETSSAQSLHNYLPNTK